MITRLKIYLVKACLWILRHIAEDAAKKKSEIQAQTFSEAVRSMQGKTFVYDERKNMIKPDV